MQDDTKRHDLEGETPPHAETVRPDLLLQVHMNEYQALMTRATYYILMSPAIWPLIFLCLGLLATACQFHAARGYAFPLMVWGGGIAVQLALMIWTFLVCEQYKIVLYTETRLRPLVHTLVGSPKFWLYEPFLKKRRKTWVTKWQELLTELIVFVAMLGAVLLRARVFPGFTRWDWIGLVLNGIVLIVLVLFSASAVRIRHAWEQSGR